MNDTKLTNFIKIRRNKGWTGSRISEALASKGVTTSTGLPYTKAKVYDFIYKKLNTKQKEPTKRAYKKKTTMVTLPVPESSPQRLVALIGSPSDVVNSLNQVLGSL